MISKYSAYRKVKIRKMTETEKAWLAATIDGEGSFGLYDYGREGRRVMIQMGNTSKIFVQEMRRIIGCGSTVYRQKFSKRGKNKHKGRKPMYHYVLKGSHRCYQVLNQIIPYLIIKKHRAQEIIKEINRSPFGRWIRSIA